MLGGLCGIGAGTLVAFFGAGRWAVPVGLIVTGLLIARAAFGNDDRESRLYFVPMRIWGPGMVVLGLFVLVAVARGSTDDWAPARPVASASTAPASPPRPAAAPWFDSIASRSKVAPARAPAPPSNAELRAPEPRRRVFSDDSSAEWLEEALNGSTTCAAECVIGGVESWSAGAVPCVAEEANHLFVSRDCRRMLALSSATIEGDRWKELPVATVYERGKKVGAVLAGTVFSAKPPGETWCQGLGGTDGSSPSYSSDGQAVRVRLSDGRDFSLRFRR